MIKCAIVKDGVVVNLIEYEEVPQGTPPGMEEGSVAIEADGVSIGWTYSNGEFTNPIPFVPPPMPPSLADMILANPEELAKLRQALGL
jgi:hypothetical protein